MDVELTRSTWAAAVRLAAIVSVVAVLVALAITAAGDVPQAAVVLPVIVVAFTASWIQTGRARRDMATARVAPVAARRLHLGRPHSAV